MREAQIWQDVNWAASIPAGPSVCAGAFRHASNTLTGLYPGIIFSRRLELLLHLVQS